MLLISWGCWGALTLGPVKWPTFLTFVLEIPLHAVLATQYMGMAPFFLSFIILPVLLFPLLPFWPMRTGMILSLFCAGRETRLLKDQNHWRRLHGCVRSPRSHTRLPRLIGSHRFSGGPRHHRERPDASKRRVKGLRESRPPQLWSVKSSPLPELQAVQRFDYYCRKRKPPPLSRRGPHS